MGTFVTGSVSAAGSTQLTTCLNLATGANRVLVRGACDSVLEMTQVWDQVAADEPVGKSFSARTLALAVLLNTGGDVSKFTKKDWASLARLQAANQAKIDGATISNVTRAKAASIQMVRATVTTCVSNTTGAARVLVSGQCQKRSETQRVWESLDPPQKPLINDGTPDIPQIEGVTVVGPTSRAVTFKPPVMVGSSPIKSITVIAIPGGQWVTISGGTGGTALFTGLSPDITYTFLAVAVNDSGAGPRVPSQRVGSRPEISVTPDPTSTPSPSPSPSPSVSTGTGDTSPVTRVVAPGAPTIGIVAASSGQASVAFTAPASTGGASITSYTVTSSPGGFTASGATSPIVVTGLTNGTAYTFIVTATNSAGTGSASASSGSTTPMGSQLISFANPGTKSFGTTPTLTATSSSALMIAFTSATTGVCTISSGGLLTFVAAGTCTISADQAGSATTSAASQVTESFTVASVAPGAPTSAVATASSAQASVAFTAPASTGGASITSYTVTSNTGGHSASGSSSPIVVTGLTNGTEYTFTVTATNSAGVGSASGASASFTWWSLGDEVPGGGGKIFYIAPAPFTSIGSDCGTSCRYLAMAKKSWRATEGKAVWCNVSGAHLGATGTGIGTGFANTVALDADCSSGLGQWVADYTIGAFSDWFLPSTDESSAMYAYKPSIAVGSDYELLNSRYATSTYTNSGYLTCRYFSTGSPDNCMQAHEYPGRPIRAF